MNILRVQEWIYRFEVGPGAKLIRGFLLTVFFVGLCVFYQLRCYKNFASDQAMDMAQLGRNISEGKGYTTHYLRPFTAFLLKQKGPEAGFSPHPDIVNPPVYPYLLAGVMKLAPVEHDIGDTSVKSFSSYPPERAIAVFNQLLLGCSALLVFFMARRLFDAKVAFTAALLLVGTDLLWRYAVSGLPINWLVLLFLGLAGLMMLFFEKVTAGDQRSALLISAGLGLLLGIGGLTQYQFLWLTIPVGLFLVIRSTSRRVLPLAVCLAVLSLTVVPWVIRNHNLSGTFFGLSGYAVYENTEFFPPMELERHTKPSIKFRQFDVRDFYRKSISNLRNTPALVAGMSLTFGFFLVALAVRFKNSTIASLQWFVVSCAGVLFLTQSLAATHEMKGGEPHPENLLVVLIPIFCIYAAVLLYIFFDQLNARGTLAHSAMVWAACLLLCSPLLVRLFPPRQFAPSYPPYWPPIINEFCKWMKPGELLLSDMPAAVAWYGRRPCSALTATARTDFLWLNDEVKSARGLYLSPRTLDAQFHSGLLKDREGWGFLVFESMAKGNVPTWFPLKKSAFPVSSGHMFLSDWERWKQPVSVDEEGPVTKKP